MLSPAYVLFAKNTKSKIRKKFDKKKIIYSRLKIILLLRQQSRHEQNNAEERKISLKVLTS